MNTLQEKAKWGYSGKIDNLVYMNVCLGYEVAKSMWDQIKLPQDRILDLVSYESGEYRMESSTFHRLAMLLFQIALTKGIENQKNLLVTSLKDSRIKKEVRRQLIGFFLDCNNEPVFRPNYIKLSFQDKFLLTATNTAFNFLPFS